MIYAYCSLHACCLIAFAPYSLLVLPTAPLVFPTACSCFLQPVCAPCSLSMFPTAHLCSPQPVHASYSLLGLPTAPRGAPFSSTCAPQNLVFASCGLCAHPTALLSSLQHFMRTLYSPGVCSLCPMSPSAKPVCSLQPLCVLLAPWGVALCSCRAQLPHTERTSHQAALLIVLALLTCLQSWFFLPTKGAMVKYGQSRQRCSGFADGDIKPGWSCPSPAQLWMWKTLGASLSGKDGCCPPLGSPAVAQGTVASDEGHGRCSQAVLGCGAACGGSVCVLGGDGWRWCW